MTQTPAVDANASEQAPAHDASPETTQSPVASRWPDSTGVLSSAIERPATSSFAVASTTPDAVNDTAAAAAGPEVSQDDKAASPAASATYSLQMLLLAAFAALTFSGLTGGTIYLARARRWRQPDGATTGWPGWSPPDDAYRLYAPPRRHRPVDPPLRADAPAADRLTSGLSENGQEIAQLLARFANQAEPER